MLIALRLNFKTFLNSHIWFPLLAILLRLIPITADFSYFILAGYALLGRQQIIEALFLSWLLSFINAEIAPYVEYASFGRYIIYLACFFSILLRANFAKIDILTLLTVGLGIFFIIHAIYFSQIPKISILKGLSWVLIIMTLLLAWTGMNSSEHEHTKKWITEFLFIIALLSLLLLLLVPGLGYIRSTTNFQGILNHPQVLGLTVAGLSALLIGQLFSQNKSKLLLLIKILICISLIIFSGCRTAGLGLLFATMISVLLFSISRFNRIKSLTQPSINKSFIIIVFFLILLIFIFDTKIYDLIISYMTKAEQVNIDNIATAYKNSREVLYKPMIANIIENPLIGIGFGLASDPQAMNIKYFHGIPISAPIEKGVLPLAILEEVGVYGFIFFMIWVLIIIRRAIADSFASLIVLLTFLLFNLGEAGLFSPNGLGMLYLIVMTSVITKSKLIKKTTITA